MHRQNGKLMMLYSLRSFETQEEYWGFIVEKVCCDQSDIHITFTQNLTHVDIKSRTSPAFAIESYHRTARKRSKCNDFAKCDPLHILMTHKLNLTHSFRKVARRVCSNEAERRLCYSRYLSSIFAYQTIPNDIPYKWSNDPPFWHSSTTPP